MATRGVSPGGALLRTSRMFSLPPPLPAQGGDLAGVSPRRSNTATRPFPTSQTITTPKASRSRGDWGLKRPLPLKTTMRSSTPLIRVKNIDAPEHTTDFASASDHTLSLQKFQEMNIPVTVPADRKFGSMNLPERSVFEEESDVTAIEPGQEAELEDKRWKFKGPWLAGMTEGEFIKFLKKQVRVRRPEFRQHMKERLAAELNQSSSQAAVDAGKEMPPPLAAVDITDAQLTDFLRRLRDDRAALYTMVGQFLDLSPLAQKSAFARLGSPQPRERKATNPYAEEGPPITHPSAGLSYLRTASYLDNHPVYGPQKAHPPVAARVVQPQHAGSVSPKLGVGGFVVDLNGIQAFNDRSLRNATGFSSFNPKVYGGTKIGVQVLSAKVDSSGKTVLKIDRKDEEAELVQKELVGEAQIFGQSQEAFRPQSVPIRRYHRRNSTPVLGSLKSYGLGGDDKVLS